jgi:alkenylglycerophosphocholine hydrolase
VTTLAVAFLISAGLAAIANWISRWRPNGALETVTKPLTTTLIVACAITVKSSHPGARWLVVAGLVFCLIGDVLLMPVVDSFVGGLGSFLVGHLLFALAVFRRPHGHIALAGLALIPLAVIVGTFGPAIVNGARRRAAALGIAVSVYLVVIASMAVMVTLTGSPWAIVGAAFFVMSDTLLGHDLFAEPFAAARVAIMVTYHLALVGLTLGLVWQ